MNGTTSHVLQRFPEHWHAITELLRTDEAFRSICEDYAQAVVALRRWENSSDPKASVRVVEFRELVTELEAEILASLRG